MKTKLLLAAGLLAVAMAGTAQSQQPAISSAWDRMTLSQDECLARARVTLERLKFTRIERVGNSIFGDQGDYQLAIRCVSDLKMFYVHGGGPNGDRLETFVNNLKSEFSRR